MLELSGTQITSLPEILPLQQNEIHLWFCRDVLQVCGKSPQGLDRIAAIQQRQQAHHFILHQLLAAYLGYPIQKEEVFRTSHGKPYIVKHNNLEFNLSHTEKTFLVGLSRSFSVGVDLENCYQQCRILELSARFFSKNEHNIILSLPPETQKGIFFQLWTAKEALLKAHGTGISAGLKQVEFKVDMETTLQLSHISHEFGALQEWQFVPLRHAHEYVGALAWRGEKCKISIFELGEIS